MPETPSREKRQLSSPESAETLKKVRKIIISPIPSNPEYIATNMQAVQKSHILPPDVLDEVNDLISKHYPDDRANKSSSSMVKDIAVIIYSILHKKFEDRINKLEDNYDKMENYSRRDNLIFNGIPENVVNTNLYISDLCEALGMSNVKLERVHRLGRFSPDRHRPRAVIARFSHYEGRDFVWRNRRHLKYCTDRRGDSYSNVFIDEDFSPKVRDRRKDMLPIAAEANLRDGYRAVVQQDTLIVNGIRYQHNELDKLPASLQDARHGIKKNDKAVAFFRRTSYLSNHSIAPFTMPDTGKSYNCSEQFIAETCALSVGDEMTAKLIRSEPDPARQKGLMKRIRNLDIDKWHDECEKLCYPGILQKFLQNDKAKETLIETGTRTLVEAAPYDDEWGVGMGLTHPQVLNMDAWKGKNHQGKILMKIRTKLQE